MTWPMVISEHVNMSDQMLSLFMTSHDRTINAECVHV